MGFIGNNTTHVNESAPMNFEFNLPWWQQFLFITAFSLLFIVAAAGNIIVIWIVMAHKRMRTVTNYFLVNLAIADTLISVLNTPFTFTFCLYQDWWYGDAYCRFTQFINLCTVTASVLTFMAIAIDRYMAIIHPLRPRMTGRVVLAICIIWGVSTFLSIPNLIYGTTKVQDFGNISIIICFIQWPDGNANTGSRTDFAYNVLIILVTYLLPMTTLAVTYSRIGVELWGSRAIGENTPVQYERIKSKRKVVKMMVVVVVMFGICWVPYHLYFIFASYTEIERYNNVQQIYLIIYWLAMSNSMYNPLIYCWMNAKFRQGFIRVFCCCPCMPCKRARNTIRHGRTLFPAGQYTTTEKYDRNGSMMQTMTDYVDDHNSAVTRKDKKGRRDSDDYL
ncbi:tachykinin-like peptides receptor 99D [Argopecten irradians]|uniref:tachykinin-like peptides receptor 99D n=1 Tax=Argopecten irradians TaxID=31199 RepID=UPI003720188F